MRNEAAQPGATARPWSLLHDDYERGTEFITADPTGEQYPICVDVLTPDAALIVYAVNHIETAEAERDEAVRLLERLYADLCEGIAPYNVGTEREPITGLSIEDDRIFEAATEALFDWHSRVLARRDSEEARG